ncbi:MAG: DUF932 domain-containing protein [Pirellulales bacterium]|nr:DUF932 domain-containing protein [Pirellulales bacterium]
MSHEITVHADGRAEAAFALTPAWHGLGAVLDHPMSSREALEAAGLGWEVVQRPMAVGVPEPIKTPEGPVERVRYHDIPGMFANVRSDNGFVLGTVSEWYKIVQNTEAFAFLDGLIESHEMQYESAFSLSGGRKVVLLGRLPKVDEIAPGDETLRYVLLSLHHDGSGAIRFGPTSVRVVCANTYAMALGEGNLADVTTDQFSRDAAIRHMGDVGKKLEVAKRALVAANQTFDAHAEAGRALAKHRMTGAEWDAFLDIMCPTLDRRDPDWTDSRAKRLDETRAAIKAAYHNERQTLPGIEGTAWAAFNAVTEHIDHLPRRGATPERKAEARFNVCLYGAGRDMKKRAFETACRFAGLAL